MRMRTALAAAALGTLVVFGGATAAHADVDDQSSVGSQGSQDWQEPSFPDQGGAAFGSEGSLDMTQGQGQGEGQEQGQGFGDAGSSFLQ